VLVAIYIVAEINRPDEISWEVTLSAKDKNPYGGYIVYQQLKDLFPNTAVSTYQLPVYNQLNHFEGVNTAYVLIEPELSFSNEDMEEMLNYVVSGNYVFIASSRFNKLLADTLKFAVKSAARLVYNDSTPVNFKNPRLIAGGGYTYKRLPLDNYFGKFDTANVVVLGNDQYNNANFIKMPFGEGAIFIHALPLCFSNDFMLSRSNADYTAKALSYLPKNINKIFWDEYYKQPEHNSGTPLRFILGNQWLRIAYRIGLLTMVLFVLFEMKRRQRIIAVIDPLRNSTLDFVKTVGNVYFNQRDNKNIALKKISYFLESIRSELYLSTSHLDEEFIQLLARKSAVTEEEVSKLVALILRIQRTEQTSDEQLLELNRQVDYFNARFSQ
jgi:hypothetical protein